MRKTPGSPGVFRIAEGSRHYAMKFRGSSMVPAKAPDATATGEARKH